MTFFASPVSFSTRKINTHIADIGIDPTIPSLLWHAQKQNNAGAIVYIQLLHLVFPLWNWYLFSSPKGLHCPPLNSSCRNPQTDGQCALGLSPFPRDWLSRNTQESSGPCSDTLPSWSRRRWRTRRLWSVSPSPHQGAGTWLSGRNGCTMY